MASLSKDHVYIKNPTQSRAVLYQLTKGGKTVTIKEIKAAFKEAGVRGVNKDYYTSKQFKQRVYWFDREVQELGFETEQTVDADKNLVAIRLIKKEKKKPAAKPAKKVKTAKKTSKKSSKKSKKVESESESDEPEESESAEPESDEPEDESAE